MNAEIKSITIVKNADNNGVVHLYAANLTPPNSLTENSILSIECSNVSEWCKINFPEIEPTLIRI